MPDEIQKSPTYDRETITKIPLEEKEIILVGTAHVSRKSAEQVR